MIHAQGIIFYINTDIIIDSATFARLHIAIKYSKFVKIFTLKHKVTKQIRFIAPKKRVFPEKKTTQQKLGQLTRQYQYIFVN